MTLYNYCIPLYIRIYIGVFFLNTINEITYGKRFHRFYDQSKLDNSNGFIS